MTMMTTMTTMTNMTSGVDPGGDDGAHREELIGAPRIQRSAPATFSRRQSRAPFFKKTSRMTVKLAPMLAGHQIEQARKLLGWSRSALARRAANSMTPNAIRNAEQGDDAALTKAQLLAIHHALTDAGVEFIGSGTAVLKARGWAPPRSS
ncbi:MAG TPA: hypothetical protein VG758_09305 [Hyphomicrobiaceae bacterium]|nr:hypothetical protein [Hyphomicrobiaceae bacterium]